MTMRNMRNILRSLVLGSAILLATTAFAANKASLHVSNPITVAGTEISPGDYKLAWEGNGPNVELSVLQGNKVVAKAPARVVDLTKSRAASSIVTKSNADGTHSLSEIYFSGKKYGLTIGGNETAQATETGAK